MKVSSKIITPIIIAGVIVIAGYYLWAAQDNGPGEGFISGNGRIEATEIDIATKLAGRVESVLAKEGDFVKKGQVLATMQTDTLQAQLNQAKAQLAQMVTEVTSAKVQIMLRESDRDAAHSLVAQRESELDALQRRLGRSSVLSRKGIMSIREFDDDETGVHGAKAAVASAKAQVAVAEASVEVVKAQAVGAEAAVHAAEATVARIQADINDSQLVAPRDGRIQYRIAEPGEVLGAGGKVLNLVDLSDVYMTFFLPEQAAGKVLLQQDVHLILDAAPQYVIPAKVSFVASSAQFTPKTVETYNERQKLMFRVKAQIDNELLLKHITAVKTGLPGVAWLKLDDTAEWPATLAVKVAK